MQSYKGSSNSTQENHRSGNDKIKLWGSLLTEPARKRKYKCKYDTLRPTLSYHIFFFFFFFFFIFFLLILNLISCNPNPRTLFLLTRQPRTTTDTEISNLGLKTPQLRTARENKRQQLRVLHIFYSQEHQKGKVGFITRK